MSRVYLSTCGRSGIEPDDVAKALEWLNWKEWIPEDAPIFLKPNLTWPVPIPGVTTTLQAIQSVVEVLRLRSRNISICESDGGYHSFTAEEAFQGHKIFDLCETFQIKAVNLSRETRQPCWEEIDGKKIQVSLPTSLLQDGVILISLPVPKVHVMTGISLGIKNQWGCNPSTMRLKEHPDFDRKIVAINKRLKPKAIFDGTYFLNGAGPMTGEAIRMDIILASDDIGSADLVCCEIMGVSPHTIPHISVGQKNNLVPVDNRSVTTNQPITAYQSRKFVAKRAFLDWISLLGFRSSFFCWLFWFSPLARFFRAFLLASRKIAIFQYFLYGDAGAPPVWHSQTQYE